MRKIKSIEVENFQSHKHTLVELSDSVTGFCGDSEQGKSVVVTKALEFLVFGTLIGEKRFGNAANSSWIQKKNKSGKVILTGDTSVKVTFTDLITVKRLMNKGGTEYFVTYPDTREDLHLTGNNGKVPDVVQELFNFNNLNLANQFERIFLLHDTPGEIAKTLNKVCDMELPTKVLKEIKSDVRKIKARKTIIDEDIIKLEESLITYKDLPVMDSELDVLDNLQEKQHEMNRQLEHMLSVLNSLTDIEESLIKYEDVEDKQKRVEKLLTLTASYDKLDLELKEIDSYISDLDYLNTELQNLGDIDKKSSEINNLLELITKKENIEDTLKSMNNDLDAVKLVTRELKELKPDGYALEIQELLELMQRRDSLQKLYNEMETIEKSSQELSVQLKQVSENSLQLNTQLQEALKDGCPVCGK